MAGRYPEFDRDEAIEAAMQVFWAHGYEGSSTRELCERTGLGKGSLYNAFGSKRELYALALQRYQSLSMEKITRRLDGPGTAPERLRALLQWGVDEDLAGTEHRSCMALYAAMECPRKDPAIQEIIRHHVAILESALYRVFAAGQRDGDISSDRPAREMARAFLVTHFGLRMLGQSMPDQAFLQEALEGAMADL